LSGIAPGERHPPGDKTMKENSIDEVANRLQNIISATEGNRLKRVDQVKAKTGRVDLPTEQRKLTQQEAAAYCGVSTATIHRWTKEGLKTITYGKRKRFTINDLQVYIKKQRSIKK
jgi:predicted DNA-binding transcriptional regulator AlpA